MNGTIRRTVLFLMLALLIAYVFAVRTANEQLVTEIPYSVVEQKLVAGQVQSVVVSETVIRGTLREPLSEGTAEFTSVRVDPQLAGALAEHQVTYSGKVQPSGSSGLLFWLLLTVALFAFWIWVFRRMAGRGGMGPVLTFGKSSAKVYVEQNTQVSFADVARVEEAKAELQEVVNFLWSPESYSRLGAHVPKEVLLGGRAAESLIYGELSTGAADDLERATDLARDMVMHFGMDETVGQVAYGEPCSAFLTRAAREGAELRRYSEATAREIECAVRQLVHAAFERASAILQRNRAALEQGASLLLERETLTREELPQVVSLERVVPSVSSRRPVHQNAAPLVRS